jgi:saccharopine dehydrogenase-like NADP-dependent oxidoreductase
VRAAILGVGGLGRTVALELASDRRVEELILVDKRGERSRALASIGRTASVSTFAVDVTDTTALRKILARVDVAVNTTLPEHNLRIMRACLDEGCGYVDTSGWHPNAVHPVPEGVGDVLEQLRQAPLWQDRRTAAIVTMGSEPGLTNVMARAAADRLATVNAIRIRVAATADEMTEGFPLYSRETFLEDVLATPLIWEGSRHLPQEPASGEETFEFPDPIGKRAVCVMRHSEVLSLPQALGKPVGRVDYKAAFSFHLIRAVHSLKALGLLDQDHVVRIGGVRIPFRDLFLSSWPEPSTLIGPMPGGMAIVTEVDGAKPDGAQTTVRGWVQIEHKEANRRRGTTAETYLSAVAGATGAILVGLKKIPRPGVLAPEELPSDLVRSELESRGVQFHFTEVPRGRPVELPAT